ncbi:ferritin-like domain-domain-containing protein [Clohesyomyces aquaticus]|uniref:Ferritin-like domain-domain-containing protein n=1 Tax=Clohesyomyces aquaticus TaxID=1231657 RepID=A0A1Y1ZG91_9PLEO|nr:ferritin-like domain-domain-containing protein [Clohesyomyces aquaticus]
MKTLTISSVVLALANIGSTHPTPKKSTITDVDILQYALTLEHLEDKFYREGLANFTLKHFEEAGLDETFYKNLNEVSYDETTHVAFLTSALKAANATPVAECTYSFGVTSVASFIATAGILEGVGVSAYLGAAASIMNKDYLTAAGSILTVESRHSSYLRGAQKQSPFPQPFDAPLDFNEVYTLAAPFITSCPESNGKLPVKAFPMLALDPSITKVETNATITLDTKDDESNYGKHEFYAAWISVTGPTYVPAKWCGDKNKFETMVPPGFHGQSYVLITGTKDCMTDDCVVAGPAIVEVSGASGME